MRSLNRSGLEVSPAHYTKNTPTEVLELYADTLRTLVMGYSSDFVPHLGHVPDKPGQFLVAGFSGHGMPQILLASKGIAHMLTDGISYEQTGLPSVFKSTNERLDTETNALEEGYKHLWEPKLKAQL